jgi:hypothetical protein
MTSTLARLWRRISRRPEQTTTVTLHVDPEPLSVQLHRLAVSFQWMQSQIGRAFTPSMTAAAEAIARLMEQFSPYFVANEPAHVAGLEARYFVRAGLDTSYADPHALDRLVLDIMTGTDELLWVNDENRSRIAASAISGWVSSYAGSEALRVLAWHRQIGHTRLSVGRAS